MGFLDENKWIGEHIELYRRDPAKAHDWQSFSGGTKPTLLLSCKGRKTGNRIDTPLVYGKHGNSFVVIGSKGGAPDHPSWFKNLLADPNAEIQVALDHYFVRARVASGVERDALWNMMLDILPHYAEMNRIAGGAREIPVVVLDPK
jgi:deazaflavin-dependent oxidoreductase (nitroreductase family)